jgi:hypothetical protein
MLTVSRLATGGVSRGSTALPSSEFHARAGHESSAAAQREASLGLAPALVSRAASNRTSAEQEPTESDISADLGPLGRVRQRANAGFRAATDPRTRPESDSVAACLADVRFEGGLVGRVGLNRPKRPEQRDRPSRSGGWGGPARDRRFVRQHPVAQRSPTEARTPPATASPGSCARAVLRQQEAPPAGPNGVPEGRGAADPAAGRHVRTSYLPSSPDGLPGARPPE